MDKEVLVPFELLTAGEQVEVMIQFDECIEHGTYKLWEITAGYYMRTDHGPELIEDSRTH